MPKSVNRMSDAWGVEHWQQQFVTAQMETTYLIDGNKVYSRLPAMDSVLSVRLSCCPDCGAEARELHIPGCDLERCPKCDEHAISCCCYIDEGRFQRTKDFIRYGRTFMLRKEAKENASRKPNEATAAHQYKPTDMKSSM